MRICLIAEHFYPDTSGMVPILLSQLVRCLCDTYQDVEIDVVTSSNLSSCPLSGATRFEYWNGARIFRIDAPQSRRPTTIKRLLAGLFFSCIAMNQVRHLHCQKNYDLVCFGTNPPSSPLVGQVMFSRFRAPYLYIVHDLYPDIAISMGVLRDDSLIVRIARRLQHSWFAKAKAVVVLGRCMQTRLIREYRLPPEKVRVITNWGDPSICMLQKKETTFRAKHNLSGFIVSYAGNIGYCQGLGTVLDAAKLLQTNHPRITFVLVGGGNAWDYMSSRIKKENITNVFLIPTVSPMEYADVLASSDVSLISLGPTMTGLAVPSKFYNILASGRPQIAIVDRDSEIAHILHKHDCGIQVDPDNGVQLANAIIMLNNSSMSRLSQMGRQARSIFTEAYTLHLIAEKYYLLFKELIEENKS